MNRNRFFSQLLSIFLEEHPSNNTKLGIFFSKIILLQLYYQKYFENLKDLSNYLISNLYIFILQKLLKYFFIKKSKKYDLNFHLYHILLINLSNFYQILDLQIIQAEFVE